MKTNESPTFHPSSSHQLREEKTCGERDIGDTTVPAAALQPHLGAKDLGSAQQPPLAD